MFFDTISSDHQKTQSGQMLEPHILKKFSRSGNSVVDFIRNWKSLRTTLNPICHDLSLSCGLLALDDYQDPGGVGGGGD